MRARALTLLGGAALLLGCPTLGAYFCREDGDCNRGGQTGVCLADNSCAYADATGMCPSGLVRSPNSDREPGQCVPATTAEGTAGSSDGGDEVGTSGQGSTDTGTTTGPLETDSSADGPSASCSELPITIAVDVLATGQSLPGYPLLLLIDDPTTAEVLVEQGDQVRALSADGDELPMEVGDPIAHDGAFAAWVRLPEYTADQPLPLRLAWGGSLPTTSSLDVWGEAYRGVWHLDDSPRGLDGDPIRNSLVPGEPGRTDGSMTAEASVPAVIGRGLAFDGDDDVVSIDAEFVGALDSYTVSLWARMDDDDSEPLSSYFQRLNGDSLYPRCWRLLSESIFCQSKNGDTGVVGLSPGVAHTMGTTIHLAMSRDAKTRQTTLYIDGQPRDVTDDSDGTFASGELSFQLGRGEWGTATATLDEVRVSDEVLPAAWIAADFATQLDPAAAIASVGDVADVVCP